MKYLLYGLVIMIFGVSIFSCQNNNQQINKHESALPYYPTTKPGTRWWWFATKIKESDIRHQLDWVKTNNFGAVEIAWVYPLYRYQSMYKRNYNRHYPKDTTAQKWLSPEWSDVVSFTKHYADSIGIACDFTFGSAWPVAASELDKKHTTQVYGDTSFQQTLTFSWAWPDTQLVINHLDAEAFEGFALPIQHSLKEALKGSKSALFTDSWEIKLNDKYKIWTEGFDSTFQETFGYNIIPYMEFGIDSFPDVRYDYMLHLDSYVTEGFYKPYVEKCNELGAWSRVQCLASPTDVMTTYGLVDIPETEAMLNNPNYSRIVSSAACLASKPMVSSESFTCIYGFPSTYLREEQTADLKMVADALFAKGVNQHFYHGTPYNPIGSDSIEFFATTYFGPGGNLEPELPEFNNYISKVSGWLQRGKTYSDIAVYIPYEDAVMKGALPEEKRRVWVWGEYELRYVDPPDQLYGYHPLWINRHFLDKAEFKNGHLVVGDAHFKSIYIDVKYLDQRSLNRIIDLASEGLPIILKQDPKQPGKKKSEAYQMNILKLKSFNNVSINFSQIDKQRPLIECDKMPEYWVRELDDGSLIIFIAQLHAKDLKYPVYCGQSHMSTSDTLDFTFNYNGHSVNKSLVFEPYQSRILKLSKNGTISSVDISFIPKDPIILPKEKQRMNF
ncbi:MAG: hypothetical protein HKN51_01580 [Saprospiraceae bacterium]|nr:hypothetical protein [Saprospiraceae bacterium]